MRIVARSTYFLRILLNQNTEPELYGGFAKPAVETCKIVERPRGRFAQNALH